MNLYKIDAIIGVKVTLLVKKGETLQQKLTILDKLGVAVPFPASKLTLTAKRPASTDFILSTDAGQGLTVNANSITLDKLQDLDLGTYSFELPVQMDNGPLYKIFGEIKVQ